MRMCSRWTRPSAGCEGVCSGCRRRCLFTTDGLVCRRPLLSDCAAVEVDFVRSRVLRTSYGLCNTDFSCTSVQMSVSRNAHDF